MLVAITDGDYPQNFGISSALTYYWDIATLSWVKGAQTAGGGGGGDASAANQVIGNASLASIDGKVLTDAQLRATAVPVSGTFFQGTQPVSGPLTDAQLRAVAVPVSGTFFQATQPVSASSLPLPAGATTETTLGTRLAEATFTARVNTQGQKAMSASTPVVLASDQSAVSVSGPLTDGQLRATPVAVSGTVTASGPLTDTQLRATPVPVSGSITASGTVTANQGTPGASPWLSDMRRGQTLAFAAIDVAASGDNTIVAADGTRKIKVLSYSLVADAAVAARWKSGAGTNLSGAMSLAANGGLADGGGNAPATQWLFETAVNQALVLNLSGAIGARGRVVYFLEA